MTLASDVFLSIEIVSLPVGGMITVMGLRQDDAPHGLRPGHAQRLDGLGLALLDGQQSGPHDLGHVGALVEAQAEYGGGDGRDEGVGRRGRKYWPATPQP